MEKIEDLLSLVIPPYALELQTRFTSHVGRIRRQHISVFLSVPRTPATRKTPQHIKASRIFKKLTREHRRNAPISLELRYFTQKELLAYTTRQSRGRDSAGRKLSLPRKYYLTSKGQEVRAQLVEFLRMLTTLK